jgi:hypothetical protein
MDRMLEIDMAKSRIDEAIAIQEMISRVSEDNGEDFRMVQNACAVTFRLLEEAGSFLSAKTAQQEAMP